MKQFFKILLLAASVGGAPSNAYASWEGYFLQTTCSRDFEYFSIKSFALGDTTELSPEKAAINGIYSLRQMVEKPFVCELKYHKITVENISHREPQATGYCNGSESANFSIKYDEKEVAQISSGGSCEGQNYTTEIIIAPMGQENCTTYFQRKDGVTDHSIRSECKPIKIPYWFENEDWYKRQEENKKNRLSH